MPILTLRTYIYLCNLLEVQASFEGLKRYHNTINTWKTDSIEFVLKL